ncbi:MAG TPA: TIGR03621 family F420-dependent LLM class oxidoreductase [Acidimicrobiia bacterium]|nr:TIGR03621 family F420-dependent LLM class oxidoreductase [Acidimicrobiia bacterium]
MRRTRSFRFGLQLWDAPTGAAWAAAARRAEELGFDVLVVPDHAVAGVLAPLAALGALAAATTRIRIGTLVLNNDFRHPALLAREAATLDLLSGGRFELGLGAGHAAPEYHELGIPFDPPGVRVSRLTSSVAILRRLFDGETVSVDGPHYVLDEHRLDPARRPTLLVGGNGDRVLRLAARLADVVGFTGLGATLPDGQRHVTEWAVGEIDAKVATVRAAAGDRVDELELSALVQYVEITEDRALAVEPIAARTGTDPDTLLASPYLLVGTRDEIVEQIRRARDRWGFSYFVTRDAEATAPIIDGLRGG